MGTANAIVAAIKQQLKSQGITYQALARRLKISEPTVKRDLGRGDFSLRRLQDICDVLGVTIADLATAPRPREALLTQLTEQQERALAGNPKVLLLTYYLVVNDWKLDDVMNAFNLDENELISLLLILDRLKIVEFRPPRGVRKLTARNFSWRKDGPVQEFFLRKVVPEYFARFDSRGDDFHFIGGSLSPASLSHFKSAIARAAAELEDLARRDARLPVTARESCTAILAVQRFAFSEFSALRKPRGSRG